SANYDLTTYIPNPESAIARHVAQFQPKRQPQDLCA
ncbi:hypothetical protein, partial [Salmonella enterica]